MLFAIGGIVLHYDVEVAKDASRTGRARRFAGQGHDVLELLLTLLGATFLGTGDPDE